MLRDIRRNDAVMGGVTLVLAGDFRQTLPIVPRGTKAKCVRSIHQGLSSVGPYHDSQPQNKHESTSFCSLLTTIPGDEQTFRSIDSVEEDIAVDYPVEFLNSLNPPGMPPHLLRLKIWAPVILLRTLNPPILCNGTRLIVERMMPRSSPDQNSHEQPVSEGRSAQLDSLTCVARDLRLDRITPPGDTHTRRFSHRPGAFCVD
ncbi:hypothetical protein RRG08_010145 [Elysia crispata]|uniref:ATP-dependent DNA helicase n=1 Tax=Elysia crispata TaxID=231223 RepID=A0AAE1CVL8_9GAST|nr:hypothetical protein RRG08_010145 [Elysia crispata]